MYVTRVRRTKEEAAATREQVLDAALIVFGKKGYTATTLQDIAEQAGLTRGAVYWHFKGKADLYTALVEERSTRARDAIAGVMSSGDSPLVTLERFLVRSLEVAQEDEDYRAVLALSWFRTELTPELEPGFRKKIDAIRWLVHSVADLVRKGIASGEIHRDVDPHPAALAAVGLMNGVLEMSLMEPKLVGSKANLRRIVGTFLRGLRA